MVQETRLWDSGANVTVSMRWKEEAHDYRYFPEPDLVPITTTPERIEAIRATLPELPDAKVSRYTTDFGLPDYDAWLLTSERATAEWFEAAVEAGAQPKAASNWIMGELMRMLNETSTAIEDCPLKPAALAGLLNLLTLGRSTPRSRRRYSVEMYTSGKRRQGGRLRKRASFR